MKENNFPGHELRLRREELGLSVYEVFRHTRIPARYIESLENSDLNALPGPCYGVGFIRTYCTVLQLEPERYVDTFRSCRRPAPQSFLRRNIEARRAPLLWLNDVLPWVVVMGVVLLGWVAYSVVFSPHADVGDNAVQADTLDFPQTPSPPEPF